MKKTSLLLLIAPMLFGACTAQVAALMPEGYNAASSKKYILNQELDEISGIAWNKSANGFVAEEDEGAIVYFLGADYSIQKSIKFGEPGDYEDIAINGNQIYVLKSNGRITEMTYNGTAFTGINHYKLQVEKAEYESLLLDPKSQNLIMICKKVVGEHEATYGYTFNTSTKTFSTQPSFTLKWKDIEAKAGGPIKHFRPSAAAVQPATGDWYLVSSIEKMLVVLDGGSMAVKSVTHLPGKDFLQPEGITFDNHSNMYITNEAAGTKPVLWYFPYQKK